MILYGIASKPVKRGPMHLAEVGLITSACLDGDYYSVLQARERSHRQVTVISLEQWEDAVGQIGADITWQMRRANLCVTGHRFGPDDVGKTLSVGGEATLQITGETEPCTRMDAIRPGLRRALMPDWRGGVTCRILSEGSIRVGDRVDLR